MKIFLISNMYPSNSDALFGVFVQNFKTEMEKQGVVFSQTALIKGRTDSSLKKAINYGSHYVRIVRGFLFSKFDLCYVHYVTHHIPVLLLLLPFKNRPWVLNAHGNDIIDLQKHTSFNFFAKILFKKTDLFVVPTSYFKKKILDNYPFLPPEKIFVSPSGGIDSDKFYVKRNKTTNSVITLGFIARFIEGKGWKTFLDALLLLKNKNILFRAIIAGKGPDEKMIKNFILQNGLIEDIDFRGFVEQEKLMNIYNDIDLYIFPTYRESESLGLTGVEAMACGTPVIACNMAGPSTYVEHGRNGYLFEPKNSQALVDLIDKYYGLSIQKKEKFHRSAVQTALGYEKGLVAKSLIERLKKI